VLATSLTIGIGGSGGVFAPSLFIGAMLGETFGMLLHGAAPNLAPTPGAYALVGMGAVFAGAARTPITAVIIMFELTGEYHIILPLMLAIALSAGISKLLSKDTIYTRKLLRRGIDLHAPERALARLTVASAARPLPVPLACRTGHRGGTGAARPRRRGDRRRPCSQRADPPAAPRTGRGAGRADPPRWCRPPGDRQRRHPGRVANPPRRAARRRRRHPPGRFRNAEEETRMTVHRIREPRPPHGLSRLMVRAPVWLYRARLGGLLGHRFLLLTRSGRRTGRPRQTVLEVVRRDPSSGAWLVPSGFGARSQ
jgi:hypothetical protein